MTVTAVDDFDEDGNGSIGTIYVQDTVGDNDDASAIPVYAGTSIGLFKLNDAGNGWSYVGFGNRKVRAVAVDFVTPSTRMFVGVDDAVGLYKPTGQ